MGKEREKRAPASSLEGARERERSREREEREREREGC